MIVLHSKFTDQTVLHPGLDEWMSEAVSNIVLKVGSRGSKVNKVWKQSETTGWGYVDAPEEFSSNSVFIFKYFHYKYAQIVFMVPNSIFNYQIRKLYKFFTEKSLLLNL